MSIEWIAPCVPEILVRGDEVYKQEEAVSTDYAMLWAPYGEGLCMVGTKQELLAVLAEATKRLFES